MPRGPLHPNSVLPSLHLNSASAAAPSVALLFGEARSVSSLASLSGERVGRRGRGNVGGVALLGGRGRRRRGRYRGAAVW